MAQPVAAELQDLDSLDRSRLHVFVAGPGTGEGIAVALPEPGLGWVLVDGCRTNRDPRGEELSLRWLLRRFRGDPDADPVRAMVLTHPHADHADGLGELIVELDPECVGIASPDPPASTLASLYGAVVDAEPWSDAEAARRSRQVEAAFKAMRRWEDIHGRPTTALRDGLGWTWDGVSLATRAPTEDELGALLDGVDRKTVRAVANRMSLVLELTFGATRIVLGGDMPADVREGWPAILDRHPGLADPCGLKIPHHGSLQALHPPLLRGSEPRCWWVTPFARQSLPRGQHSEAQEVREGMALLLEHQEAVQVTSLPTARSRQQNVPPPGQVGQSEWDEAFQAKDLGGVLAARAVEVGPPPGVAPGEPFWGAAFDDGGACVARWRGAVAMEVVRGGATVGSLRA